MKRRPITPFIRIIRGWKVGLLVFTTLGGLLAWYSITGKTLSIKNTILLVGCCIIVSIIVAYFKGRISFIPQILIDQLHDDGQYACKFSTRESLSYACELTKNFYRSEYVEPNIVEIRICRCRKLYRRIMCLFWCSRL